MRPAAGAAVAAAALAVTAAACSAGPRSPAASTAGTPRPSATPPVTAVAGAPGCVAATAAAPRLTGVPTALEAVPGTPFGVVADGRWSFVSLPDLGSVGVYRIGGPGLPVLARQVPAGGQPLGEALAPGGRYLLAADGGSGAVVINVSRAESGGRRALLGTLRSGAPNGGAIEVTVSPDGRFAFVSLEDSSSIAVYDLRRALAKGFGAADLVGTIPVGIAPVGLAVSPDGRWLYATSEYAPGSPVRGEAEGTLTVIGLHAAETDPAGSVVASVDAGCSPVRVITSAGGGVVWVTARGSDRLLGFSAALLRSRPARSLIASVGVGEAPVGLALAAHGSTIVVADSNRFGAAGAASSLAVVGVAAALARRPALLGYLRAGAFPREMALEPAGRTLLVTCFASMQLEAVGTAGLP